MRVVRPVGVALGSNQGDRLEHLRAGLNWLRLKSRTPVRSSRVYETDPVGCAAGTPAFLNAVCEILSDEDPLVLLRGMRALERAQGRPEVYERNAPRTLDMDVLYAGTEVIATEELTLPHPRLIQRRFVLQPLADVRPELILPGQTQSVHEILCALTVVEEPRVFRDKIG